MTIKTTKEIEVMKEGGEILGVILRKLIAMTKPGITTMNLETAAEGYVREYKVRPSFLGYDDYPAILCTSIRDSPRPTIRKDYQRRRFGEN